MDNALSRIFLIGLLFVMCAANIVMAVAFPSRLSWLSWVAAVFIFVCAIYCIVTEIRIARMKRRMRKSLEDFHKYIDDIEAEIQRRIYQNKE